MISTASNCTACGACVSACPTDSISLQKNTEGFFIPHICHNTCIQCGKCQDICPASHRPAGRNWQDGSFFALWAWNKTQRMESSSGGAFGLLADEVLAAGGVVFGAAYADDWKSVIQTSTASVPLTRLKKSKYAESFTGTVFRSVRSALESGKKVLYCGTSCQIDGLMNYLGKPFENLLTCDFLCHGVPAAGIYEKYITDLETRYGKVTGVDFRSKAYGWKAYCSKVTFASEKTYLKTLFQDPYLRIFFDNSALRIPCRSCRRTETSNADLTLGDFWRVKESHEIPNTNEGVSLVCVHTPKGQAALEELFAKERCFAAPLPQERCAYAYQKAVRHPKNNAQSAAELLNENSLLEMKIPAKLRLKGVLYHLRAVLQKFRIIL